MQGRPPSLYKRGKYRLVWDRRTDGTLRSPYLAVVWYDAAAGRNRSTSTRTAEVDAAMLALDRLYLADRQEASAYCHHCGQPIARAEAYLLTDAIADYRLEVGDTRDSATTIAARLKHVVDFLVATGASGTSCKEATRTLFIDRFRAWSRGQPVTWKNGEGHVTKSRPRAPATTEESVIQLCAVLNHAVAQERSDTAPAFKPIPRKRVTSPRRIRCDAAVLADMLSYAAEPKRRRGSLHAFLVASICTIGRPDAIVDISTDPARRQWQRLGGELHLNQAGRVQTKKHRATVPVLPILEEWLLATATDAKTNGWLVNYFGSPVQDVDRAWSTMLGSLGLPADREWMPYVVRHSIATLCRAAGVHKWELQAFMGHRAADPTETYAVATAFPTVSKALSDILADIDRRAPGALHRTDTGVSTNIISLEARKMSG